MAEEPLSSSRVDTPRSARDLVTASLSGDSVTSPPERDGSSETLVGRQLGQFRVEERIGAGGLGVVYRAYDVKLKRPVALKVLARGGAQIDRLLAEARSAAPLTHPCIAAIYDVQQVSGVAFLVMELVEGCTLREELAGGRLGPARVVAIALDVASAIARAHQLGIVHRDLKPENVMISKDGAAKILDFGLARDVAASSTDAPGSGDGAAKQAVTGVAGTRHYMSPEQAAGRAADVRSDVFSFGVMLYEMVTGRRPFPPRAEPDSRAWDASCFQPSARVRATARHAPRALERIIDRCLQFEAHARFTDGADLLTELRKVDAGDGRRGLLAALSLVGVAAMGLGAYFVHHRADALRASVPPTTTSSAPSTHPRRALVAAGQTWEIVDGEWLQEGSDLVGRSGHIQTSADLTDALIELDADMAPAPTATIGIGFRYSLTGDNPRAQCGYGVNFRTGPEVATFLGEDGDWGALGPGYRSSPALHLGKNHFAIRMQGSAFVVEVNGQPIDSFQNARWPNGRVNLWVARTETRFSNVRITPLPVR